VVSENRRSAVFCVQIPEFRKKFSSIGGVRDSGRWLENLFLYYHNFLPPRPADTPPMEGNWVIPAHVDAVAGVSASQTYFYYMHLFVSTRITFFLSFLVIFACWGGIMCLADNN
jgi:hypothetical protein